jgi:hypothetical protein
MPIISVFFGIIIRMYYKEHEPGHFHAEHQGQQGKFAFSGEMTVGNIQSKTALRLIREWAGLHQAELQANWEQMKAGRPLSGIAPLE